MTVDISRVKGLLAYFYSQASNANNEAILRIIQTEIEEIQTVIDQVSTGTDIDQATGYSLDILGSNVGEARLGRSDSDYSGAGAKNLGKFLFTPAERFFCLFTLNGNGSNAS